MTACCLSKECSVIIKWRSLVNTAAILAVWILAMSVQADTYPQQVGVDARHYRFSIRLLTTNDNRIQGEAAVTLRILSPKVTTASLDLANRAKDGKGMTVSKVTLGDKPARFTHKNNRLKLSLPKGLAAGDEFTFVIDYSGSPRSGLRLIENMHGEPTAFSENWHNNARQWLPVIDHPSDKASGEFIITTKANYQVVATGQLIESRDLAQGLRRTHWKQQEPIAAWLYAIGVAKFVVKQNGLVKGTPMSYWAFAQDDGVGLETLQRDAQGAFEFFSERIAPYPYAMLAHVQAAGIGGATEHATNIFYGEHDVADGRAPTVHETVHQWFGNTVTPKDWDDVWLSEGFATYLALLYFEHTYGRDDFVSGLKRSRNTVLNFESAHPNIPLVHQNLDEANQSPLNPLVYEKGAWVLHMLRHRLGAQVFWKGLREYYQRHRHAHASSDDFRRAMEQVADIDLKPFFNQWLHRSGVPKIDGSWSYNPVAKSLELMIEQTQAEEPYHFALQIGLKNEESDWSATKTLKISERITTVSLPIEFEPKDVTLDPNVWLLAEFEEFSELGE